MNNIEILEEWLKEMDEHFKSTHINNTKEREALRFIIQENKELKEKINKSIEFINDDNTFFEDGENWQNVLHIERILKGE